MGKTPSGISNLCQLAALDAWALGLLARDDLRADDGARLQAAMREDRAAFVRRAVVLASLEGAGGEVSIEMAVSVMAGALKPKSPLKPMVLLPNDGALERAGRTLTAIADVLAQQVEHTIRPPNPLSNVTLKSTGWLRLADPLHLLVQLVSAPTPADLEQIRALLLERGLLR